MEAKGGAVDVLITSGTTEGYTRKISIFVAQWFYPKALIFVFLALLSHRSLAAEIDPFIGSYAGTAEVESGGETSLRVTAHVVGVEWLRAGR